MKKSLKLHRGFTLIELLVVISIIGLLSTLAVVSFGNARKKSRDSKRVSDMKQIQTALELYFGDVESYPSGANKAMGQTGAKTLSQTNGFSDTAAGTKYMDVPRNPTPVASGCNTDYIYNQTGSGSGYTLEFCLEAATGELGAGTHTASPSGISR